MDYKARNNLKKLNGANFAFFICEKMRIKGHRIEDDNIVLENGKMYENTTENMTYVIEKFFYESNCFQTHIDVAELVMKYKYIFENELLEEEEDTIKMLVSELAK